MIIFAEIWPVLKIIFLILDAVLVVAFIIALFNGWPFRPNLKVHPKHPKKAPTLISEAVKEHWLAILEKLETDDSETLKLAVIEADALVGDTLRQLGYEGDSLAIRLGKVDVNEFPTVEKVKRAHRLRNELVHTPGFKLSNAHAKSMILAYELFLKELDLLNQ